MIALAQSYIADPFRIGLLVALFATMWRTRAATGVVQPLLLGALFVAVIVPVVMQGLSGADLVPAVAVGVAVNLVWLAILWCGWQALTRLRR